MLDEHRSHLTQSIAAPEGRPPIDLSQSVVAPVERAPISCGFLMCSLLSGVSAGVLTGLVGCLVANSMRGLEALRIGFGAGLFGSLFHAFDYRYGSLVQAERSLGHYVVDVIWYTAFQVVTAIMSCNMQHMAVSINDTATCFFWGAMVTILPVRQFQLFFDLVCKRITGFDDYPVQALAEAILKRASIVESDQLPTAVEDTGRNMLEVAQAAFFSEVPRLCVREGEHCQNPIHTV